MVSKKNGTGKHDASKPEASKVEKLKPAPELIVGAPQARPVTITPDMAYAWLENPSFNIMNRPVRQSDVNNWAAIMRRGEWQLNGDSIRISKTGKLLDGQHRLYACIEANTEFQAYLIEGLEDEVFDSIDVGKKRSASDMLKIHNKMAGIEPMKHEGLIMAAITTILEYKFGTWRERHSHVITHHEKLDFLEKNPAIKDWVLKARVKGTKRWENTYAANIGAVAFLGSKKYQMKADTFVIGFTTGNDLPVGSPISALRNRLGAEKHYEKWDRMKLIIYAWNLHVDNSSKLDLRMPAELPVIAGTEAPIKISKTVTKKRIHYTSKGTTSITHVKGASHAK